jgi:tricorn protease
MRKNRCLFFLLAFLLFGTHATAQIDARMLRQPDVSEKEIAFVYAGDIWVVPKEGGTAQRLTSPLGEESFPRFSPDGSRLAFSANYDGNTDVYVVPHSGGLPSRLTHHPMGDRVLDWYPDGRSILLASARESGRQRYNQLFRLPHEGGLPEKLPVPYGEFGTISPDSSKLAYIPKSRDNRTWKRYRGGWAPDIWIFDLKTLESENITSSDANDTQPMWHGNTLYFLSDRDANKRYNIWSYNLRRKSLKQVTRFEDIDIHFPAIGPSDIVFEAGGELYLLDLGSQKYRPIEVRVLTDQRTLKPRVENVGRTIQNSWISPTGKRAVFEARGEIFTVPAEHGVIRNITHDSATAARYPTWSPDGQYIAYWSDRSGEYELTIRKSDGSGEEETLTSLGAGFRYRPFWSPDSKKIAFVDQAMKIQLFDLDAREARQVDRGWWMTHGALNGFRPSWSSDSQWLAYSRGADTRTRSIFLYNTESKEKTQVTSGYYDDMYPVFDPDGKYLYFLTDRHFSPSYSDYDNSWVYANATRIAAVPLRPDIASPLAPRNDEEKIEDKTEGKEKKSTEEEGQAAQPVAEEASQSVPDAKGADKKKEEPPVEIILEGFEQRVVLLPPAAGNYSSLGAAPGKVVYQRNPRTGAPPDSKSSLVYYDVKERKEEEVLSGVNGWVLSADFKKTLVRQQTSFSIVDLKPKQQADKKLRTSELEMIVDPRAEWRQIFHDAWRFERDYFYDPGMHGVDWPALRQRYASLIEQSVTRWDVNYVLGELISELNASHTYRGGGDNESTQSRGVGMLGVDWARENGAYRIQRIIRGAPWDAEVRSPLDEPNVNVSEGDYVLAVNGVAIDPSRDPWAAFQGLNNKTISLTVNDQPTLEDSRDVLVKTLSTETRLRHLDWIESNRKRVEEASEGRVGYIYVRSTGIDGQSELVRQFYAQAGKAGLIIDERFNSGGQIPDRFIEVLNRQPLSFWAVRDGKDWTSPPVAHSGPKVMLINGWSGSGGDAFPYYFREAGIGPLIGSTTWGGLIGVSGVPPLVDGGRVTVPTFRMYSVGGEWFAEGRGVKPDIEVPEDPTQMARGKDPQLERAIAEVLRSIERKPPARPVRPKYEDRSR